MKIGIYGQFYHENSEIYIQMLLDALQKRAAEVVIEENFLGIINQNQDITKNFSALSTFTELDSSFDLFFSIGGDGTILKAVTFVGDLGIPIVGINTGRLGFLATIQKEEMTESLNQILEGEYSISERSLLTVETFPKSSEIQPLNFALNEVAVNRRNTTSMIKVETLVNDKYLTSYWSDGLIVATPTGSTGYSLSCGGPVIAPDANNMVLTPIAPHNLNARPLVIPDSSTISLKVSGRENTFLVSMDSRIATLANETEIIIKKAPFTIKLLQLHDDSFIKTLRKKLLWGEDKRN
ncbi:MAG: NAD kinase [Aequorivita sp.]|nr:NAD kinase [Aequorivita sp.]MAO47559.1 NAD kinase [Aequorivita sp.]MBF32249.1 NAD kinase [Aequorivita sp.]HAV54263.1 NAD kinase [Aequorivita sp.]HBL78736.1 NAD kinase [Aequorivita sp.]|tara:strand:+ start:57176 stop:58060 length:885 start_codon:yes stop_codon:yes gene_type:complete